MARSRIALPGTPIPATGEVHAMSDRRFLVVLVAALAALVGAGLVVLAVVLLQHPVHTDVETGRTTDTTRSLVGSIVLGTVLCAGGASVVVGLIRAQLRGRQ